MDLDDLVTLDSEPPISGAASSVVHQRLETVENTVDSDKRLEPDPHPFVHINTISRSLVLSRRWH